MSLRVSRGRSKKTEVSYHLLLGLFGFGHLLSLVMPFPILSNLPFSVSSLSHPASSHSLIQRLLTLILPLSPFSVSLSPLQRPPLFIRLLIDDFSQKIHLSLGNGERVRRKKTSWPPSQRWETRAPSSPCLQINLRFWGQRRSTPI